MFCHIQVCVILFASFSIIQSQENFQYDDLKQSSVIANSESNVETFHYNWINKSIENEDTTGLHFENIVINDYFGVKNIQVSLGVKELATSLKTLQNKPVIFLIQDAESNIEYSFEFQKNLTKLGIQCEFIFMKFNATGVSEILNLSDLKTIEDTIIEQVNYLGYYREGGATFYSILKATILLPSDTAIILFANEKVIDEDLAQLALTSLKSKRIKLYVIWTGNLNNEEKLLQETALLSGGNFIVEYVHRGVTFENAKRQDNIKDKALVFVKYNVKGFQKHHFNVERNTNALYIILAGPLENAFLFTPNGKKINLCDEKEVFDFSPDSYIKSEEWKHQLQIQINMRNGVATPYAGKWRLETKGSMHNDESYNITVFVSSQLLGTAFFLDKDDELTENVATKKRLHIYITGNISKIENVALLDTTGNKIRENIMFFERTNDVQQGMQTMNLKDEPIFTKDVEVYDENLPQTPFYVQFSGQDDIRGTNFTRLSYVNPIHDMTKKNPITVEMGSNSNLIVNPGQTANIYYEVTNNRDQPIYLYFQCNDEKRFLRRMTPLSAYVAPAQTTVVTVEAYARPDVPQGTTNMITFTILGQDYDKKSANMIVGDTRPNDDINPRVWHRYTSDCTDILLSSCETGTWTIEVTAQDLESGLLSFTTSPIGINIPNGFISGTKEQVIGYYSGTCCSPDLQLTAVDLYKNHRTYTANAYRANLSAGAITAIVLGILFILLIIAIIVFFVVRRNKQKNSIDLPTYRSPRSQTRTQ